MDLRHVCSKVSAFVSSSCRSHSCPLCDYGQLEAKHFPSLPTVKSSLPAEGGETGMSACFC